MGTHIQSALKGVKCEIFIPRQKDGIDFRIYNQCESYLQGIKPDILINCAANQGGIGYYEHQQADIFLDNMNMNLFLLKATYLTGVKKFLNIIPNCSYPGYLEKEELNEEDFWNGEIHDSIFSYGFPRHVSVAYGKALKKQFGFNSIHLVLANMYGPWEHFNEKQSKALAAMIRKMYEAKRDGLPKVEIWGTGRPIRDWLYVKDGAEGVLRAGAVYDEIEPLNIATGIGISVRDLANLIKKIAGYNGELFFNTTKSDGAFRKVSGVKKMKEKLGWAPQTSLEKGITETFEWFTNNYDRAISY